MNTVRELLEAIKGKKNFEVQVNNSTEISMRHGEFSPSCGHLGAEFTSHGVKLTFDTETYQLSCWSIMGSINVLVDVSGAYVYNHVCVDRLVIPLAQSFKGLRLYITINSR